MAKANETGHAINVANLEKLTTTCIGFESNYNPSNKQISLSALKLLHQTASEAQDNVIETHTLFKNSVTNRQIVFDPAKPLATRIINSLEATEASNRTINNAKAINKKIQGTKIDRKKSDDLDPDSTTTEEHLETMPDKRSISTSQQSYINIREHFKNLVSILKIEDAYKPNELDLQIASLEALIDAMASVNSLNNQASINLANARIKRNAILYNPKTGLFDISKEVKKYVKSVYGSNHPHNKQIRSIKFTNQLKK